MIWKENINVVKYSKIGSCSDSKYSETCINRTPFGPAIVFGIDRCSDYTGVINKDILHWDFI